MTENQIRQLSYEELTELKNGLRYGKADHGRVDHFWSTLVRGRTKTLCGQTRLRPSFSRYGGSLKRSGRGCRKCRDLSVTITYVWDRLDRERKWQAENE